MEEQQRVRAWAPATTQQSPLETGRVEFVEADALLVDASVELAKTSGLGVGRGLVSSLDGVAVVLGWTGGWMDGRLLQCLVAVA